MTSWPRLVIDLEAIAHNARVVVGMARRHGMAVTGVTKAACGDPRVAAAMLAGGVASLGDSRVRNLRRLAASHPGVARWLLRLPMGSRAADAVRWADLSLNSEPDTLHRLDRAARAAGRRHGVVLMVEMGDLREGLEPGDLHAAARRALDAPGLELAGVGMNLACFGGVVPTAEKVRAFSRCVERLERRIGRRLPVVSGGNSANLRLLARGHPATRINHLRVGEGILLGVETVARTPIAGARLDALRLELEIIELREKDSVPSGRIAQNAFGDTPVFPRRGRLRRAILAGGRQDFDPGGLTAHDPDVEILGASSDHLVVAVHRDDLRVGGVLSFRPDYGSLLRAWTSPYVRKRFRGETPRTTAPPSATAPPTPPDRTPPTRGTCTSRRAGCGRPARGAGAPSPRRRPAR
jgi:predicted amino acid racemase